MNTFVFDEVFFESLLEALLLIVLTKEVYARAQLFLIARKIDGEVCYSIATLDKECQENIIIIYLRL